MAHYLGIDLRLVNLLPRVASSLICENLEDIKTREAVIVPL